MTKKSKKTTNKKPMVHRWWIWAVGALFAIMILSAVALSTALRGYNGDEAWIYVPSGASGAQVDSLIKANLGSDDGTWVSRLWQWQGGNASVAHGAYRVTPGESRLSIARRLAKGRQTPVTVTWTDVRTMPQLAERVAEKMEFDADSFLIACAKVLPDSGFTTEAFPAAFLPDSYEMYWSADAESAVKRLLGYRNQFWNAERREQAKALGLTPVQVATVASIVEEETAKADERGKVARLYLNRLAINMPLQADPTVKFAIGDFSIRRVTLPMLSTDSPYNTYRVKGLPPGPIRVAAASTIDAVLQAPEHKYIYMCAKEDFSGYHNFAVDYETHKANARRYQDELNRRGIR